MVFSVPVLNDGPVCTCTVGKKQFNFDLCVVAKVTVQELSISFSFTHFQTGSRSILFYFYLFI